jgi:hypothetical protein
MGRFLSLFCVLACLASPALAAPSRHPVKKVKPHAVANKPKVQAHYSFLPSKPVTGIVSQANTIPVMTCEPVPRQATPPQVRVAMPLAEKAQSRHKTMKAKSPQKERGISPWSKIAQHLPFPHNNTGIKQRSWVADVSSIQSEQLALLIADFASNETQPENTTILLASPTQKQARNTLTPALKDALRQSGFALVDSIKQKPKAEILQYQVQHLDEGLLLRISYHQKEASRYFDTAENQGLLVTSPFSIRLQGEP